MSDSGTFATVLNVLPQATWRTLLLSCFALKDFCFSLFPCVSGAEGSVCLCESVYSFTYGGQKRPSDSYG